MEESGTKNIYLAAFITSELARQLPFSFDVTWPLIYVMATTFLRDTLVKA